MAEIDPLRRNIFFEETQFRSAVSEAVAQKLGASINFINTYQASEKQFFINGNFSRLDTYPATEIDGFTFAQTDIEIMDTWMFVQFAGSAGTTELDIKVATTPGGSFTSIFSTTPKISYLAGNNIWIHLGSALSNTTAPVLSTTTITAGSAMRCDIIQPQTGDSVNGCGIVLHYRPVSPQ